MIEETSSGVILFRKENEKMLFLLLLYQSGHRYLVKGKIESGESKRENAIR